MTTEEHFVDIHNLTTVTGENEDGKEDDETHEYQHFNSNVHLVINEKSSKYCCSICKKPYTKKDSLDKHMLLCEYKSKTLQEKQIEFEESTDIPDYKQLVRIVQELAIKYAKMDEKLSEIHRWVTRKKAKLNVVQWLNTHIVPETSYQEWIAHCVSVLPEHFEYLMENNLIHAIEKVYHHIFDTSTQEQDQTEPWPVRCFTEKKGVIYICDKGFNEEGQTTVNWHPMEQQHLSQLMTKIHAKMLQSMITWKEQNQSKFDDEHSKIAEKFNKAVIKFMDMKYTLDSNLGPYKSALYNYLRNDLKGVMEYDFEF